MRMRQAIGLSLALWAISGIALAKQTAAATDRLDHPHSTKPNNTKAEPSMSRHGSARRRAQDAANEARGHTVRRRGGAAEPGRGDRLAGTPAPRPDAIKVVGRPEIGIAAWYGGHHVGGRTASGAVLDSVTPTAAHRSLPLNSLVRITNLRNGRSVICTVNDRGPWGANRLIDVSPRAADELDMKRSGIAKVSVEPIAKVANGTN